MPHPHPPRDRVMIAARISREIAAHVRLAAAKRAIDREPPTSIAAIVEAALRLWLKQHRYL